MTVRPTSAVRSFLPGLLVATTLAVSFGSAACQADEPEKKAAPPVGGGATGGSSSGGKGGSGSGAKGGTGGTESQGGSDAGEAGAAGSGFDDPCGGIDATLEQINNPAAEGALAAGKRAKVAGLVATSHKFLASASSCLWAVTATTAGDEVQPYGSIQIISKGKPALVGEGDEKGPCPQEEGEAGVIPNDIKPGDIIDITAFVSDFTQQSCDGTKNPKPAIGQKQLDHNPEKMPGCFVVTKGEAVPAPHAFTAEEATAFAEGKNADDINSKWSAALITLSGPLTPKQSDKPADYPSATAAVSKFGDLLLKESTITINNNVVYQDITGTGPKDSAKRVCWPLTTTFDNITGLGLIDFCTFSLSLRSTTGDVTPESKCE